VGIQPIVQSFGNAYFNDKSLFNIPVILGLLFLLLLRFPKKIGKGINGQLNWEINHINMYFIFLYGIYYFIFMSLPLLWQVPYNRFLPLFYTDY